MGWKIRPSPRMNGRTFIDDTMKPSGSRELVATSKFFAVRYQDDEGKIVHRYDLPGDFILKDYTKHYFRYLEFGAIAAPAYTLKFSLTQTLLNLMRSMSDQRKTCGVLEIGSTIGETYYLLKELLSVDPIDMVVEFVGLDMNSNCVSFARDLFAGDPNFQNVVGEASDLSRFPDDTFDFVISNGVHNHVRDQGAAMREAVRASRVATIFRIMMSAAEEPQRFQGATGRDTEFVYQAPTAAQMFSYFPNRAEYFWYIPTQNSRHGVKWDDGRYLDIDEPDKVQWHTVIVAKHPILSGGRP
jgi:SAM-dependent methyltransferase